MHIVDTVIQRWDLLPSALLVAALAAPAGAQQQAASSPLSFDSIDVRRLLTDAIGSAREAPVAQRASLLAAAGRIQVEAGDFAGAERTIALTGDAAPADVLRQLGLPEWFAMLDHADLARRLVCGLHTAGRPDDALSVVRRMPAGPQREWLLGHEAVMTVYPPDRPDSAAKQPNLTAARGRAALAIARGIALPEARLDALIMVMGALPDTGDGGAILRGAYAEARTIRLADGDRQASRDAQLAGPALRVGRPNDVLALFAGVSDPEDLEYILYASSQRREGDRILRTIAPRVIAAGRAIADDAARKTYLAEVHAYLEHSGGRAFADGLVPEARVDTAQARADRARISREDALLAATYPEDAARRALEQRDFAEVHRQVERIPLGNTGARRAEVWSELAWWIYMTGRDTAKAFLGFGRASLRPLGRISSSDSAEFDRVAEGIATRYFWLGDVQHGIETVAMIGDPEMADGALRDWGASTFGRPSPDSIRAYVDRTRDPRVHDAALARFVEIELVPIDIRRARSLADSIATPRSRAAARLAVANALRRQRDTSATRRAFMELVSDSSLGAVAIGREVLPALVSLNAWRDIEAWARSATADPAERARRLIAVANSLNRELLVRSHAQFYFVVGNGPDDCLDVF
jgi:hypothetical protein